MLYIAHAPLNVYVAKGVQIQPDDVLDAASTLTPQTKVCIPIPPPGQGPEQFLRWAKDELAEAEVSTADAAGRKAFNCAVLAKCAVECLADWYLDRFLLNRTLPPYTGLVKKLQALEASERLGIGLALFDTVIFEPRNDAVHAYEPVDPVLVRQAVELADLTVRNLIRADPPGLAPIFYGTIELLQGRAAIDKIIEHDPRQAGVLQNKDLDGLWLKSLGPEGEVSVLFDRHETGTRVVLLTSDGHKSADDVRFCPVDRAFGTERLQRLIQLLERKTPAVINVTERNVHTVVNSLANRNPEPKKRP